MTWHTTLVPPRGRHGRQRGAAILMAMLTVVLVATMASAMLWQQWRGVDVESAQRTRVQSAWMLTGALDWARLILREDARQGGADHLAEPWAVPLAPARLNTFLAAERGQALVRDDTNPDQDAFLAGAMQDLQARLNLTNLVQDGQLQPASVSAWVSLFEQLGLPPQELEQLLAQLRRANAAAALTPAAKPDPQAPLWPQDVVDLAWLGLSVPTVQALAPYVAVLPRSTTVNLNTAPIEVLVASTPGLSPAQARQLVQQRDAKPFTTLADATQAVANPEVRFDAKAHGVSSQFFSVTGQLRVGSALLQERSVVQRDGLVVKTLSRQRQVVSGNSPPLQ